MGFVGSYSNVEAVDRVRRLLPKLEKLAAEVAPRRPPGRLKHREPAPILRAVREVLEEAVTPIRAVEVHRAVEYLRGEPVAWSSVKDCLASNAKPGGRFIRVARGRYQLARDTGADAVGADGRRGENLSSRKPQPSGFGFVV